MHTLTTKRAEFAATSLIYIEIALGTLSFWDHAIGKGGAIDYIAAAIMTWAFGSVSLLVSGIVTRFAEADGHKLTRGMIAFVGGVLILLAGGMTLHGLTWLDEKVGLAPMPILVGLSFLLSLVNVISFYAFVREIGAKAQTVVGDRINAEPTPAEVRAELLKTAGVPDIAPGSPRRTSSAPSEADIVAAAQRLAARGVTPSNRTIAAELDVARSRIERGPQSWRQVV